MSCPRWLTVLIAGSFFWFLITSPGWPQPEETQEVAEDVAEELTNPIAHLFAVPIELQYEAGVGNPDGTRMTLHARPIVPFAITPDWLVITLTQLSLIHQSHLVPGAGAQLGLGNVMASQLFTPGRPGPDGLLWALGPVTLLPTATSPLLGLNRWALGPMAVVVKHARPFTVGLMANHLRSVGGDPAQPDLQATSLQPFVSHVSAGGLTLGVRTEAVYSWTGGQWNVPLDLTASQVVKFGERSGNVGATFRMNPFGPAATPDWMVSMQVTPIFQRIARR